ncbi:MAG: 50S ribosomal protein L18 [Deinococcus sp.]|nr:50S ribosomal protein L18 [Deinococcus sp.]
MGERPRLSIYRSSKHIYAQIIDDKSGTTLAAASTGALKEAAAGTKTDRAAAVGKALAEAAAAKGVKQVAFDRGQYRYHGRVKALADAAREGGLDF